MNTKRPSIVFALSLLVLSGLSFSYVLESQPESFSAEAFSPQELIAQLPSGVMQAAAISGAASGIIEQWSLGSLIMKAVDSIK